jgi:hypothetical protein
VRLFEGALWAFRSASVFPTHAIWIAIRILAHYVYWWSLWQFQSNTEWNFARFVLLSVPAVILYLQATLLVTSAPQSVTSWREHYFSIAPSFFALNIAYILALPFVFWLGDGNFGGWVTLPVMAASVGLYTIAMHSTSERTHGVIAVIALVLMLVTVYLLAFTPAQLAPAA